MKLVILMKDKKVIWRLFLISVIILIVGTVLIFGNLNKKLRKYKLIKNNSHSSFVVSDIYEYRGELFLNDSILIGSAYDNAKPFPKQLLDVIEVDDLIVKNAYSDTIHLVKKDRSFWFIHYSKK